MSCIICLDEIENTLLENTSKENNDIENNLIKNKKTLHIICKTCKCGVCEVCMIQYVNEFKNTECPKCRLEIDVEPFLDQPSTIENENNGFNVIISFDENNCFRIYFKIPVCILVYLTICYLIGEEFLKNQLHMYPSSPSFFILSIFVGMIIVNICGSIVCYCCSK